MSVPAAATYITGTSVDVTVSASKTGLTSPSDVTRTLAIDLSAPTAPSYTAPATLTVGTAMTALAPTGGAGIAASNGYAAAGLPAGLAINAGSGVITGTPSAAAAAAAVTVTVADGAGNAATADIAFPAVAKGDQDLSGFGYTPTTLNYGDTAPVLSAPMVADGAALSYTSTTTAVCTVADDGALTILTDGACTVTAATEATANYNAATSAEVGITVNPAGAVDGITLDPTELSVTEGVQSGATYTVALASQPTDSVTITISGFENTDLTLDNPNLTFTTDNWATVQTVRVTAAEDNDDDNDIETLRHEASDGGYNSITANLQVTVEDDDKEHVTNNPPPLPQLSDRVAVVDELFNYQFAEVIDPDGHGVSYEATMANGNKLPDWLNFNPDNRMFQGTPQDPDVVQARQSRSQLRNDEDPVVMSMDITVRATDDGSPMMSSESTFELKVIRDNGTPILSIADQEVKEDAGVMVFTVRLTPLSAQQVTVYYATEDQTARGTFDYERVSGVLHFAPGQTEQPIELKIRDDDLYEEDETFRLTLSDPVNAVLGQATATGTIIDDDEMPTLYIRHATAAEGAGELVFRVVLEPTGSLPVTVQWATWDGTAEGRADYRPSDGTLTFNPGEGEKKLRVPVIDDAVDENTENLRVTLSNQVNALLGRATGTGYIYDDDVRGIRVTPQTVQVDEGSSAGFEVVLATQPVGSVTLTLMADAAGSTLTPDQLHFDATNWSVPQTVVVAAPTDEDMVDADRMLMLTASGGDYVGVLTRVVLIIRDSERPPDDLPDENPVVVPVAMPGARNEMRQ